MRFVNTRLLDCLVIVGGLLWRPSCDCGRFSTCDCGHVCVVCLVILTAAAFATRRCAVFDLLVIPLAVEVSPSDSMWTTATLVAPLEVYQAPLEVIVLLDVFARHRLHVAGGSPLELAADLGAPYFAGSRLHR